MSKALGLQRTTPHRYMATLAPGGSARRDEGNHEPVRLIRSLALTAPIGFNSYVTTTYCLTFSVSTGVPGRRRWPGPYPAPAVA